MDKMVVQIYESVAATNHLNHAQQWIIKCRKNPKKYFLFGRIMRAVTFLKGRSLPFPERVPSGKIMRDKLFSTIARAACKLQHFQSENEQDIVYNNWCR